MFSRRVGAISAAGERKRNTALGSIDGRQHLSDLNPAQRSAVEYGIGGNAKLPPALLIAAGAGTGKTKTLAHRVAHLILNGADPQRLLLLTFTRRSALEMTRRAQQILTEARGDAAHRTTSPTAVLPWSGTFHAIGSRLLRLHAAALGLDPSFTILDRTDSADVLDLARSELGLARTVSRFPRKSTCLAIYSFTVNAGCPLEETLARSFPYARTKGARVIEFGGPAKPGGITHARKMVPTIVLNVTDEMNVMRDEIFGPILPIIPYRDLEDAVGYVNSRPRPLALYFFGPSGLGRQMVLERTTSGGVSINETNLHYAQDDIPFGGVGPSGMGAYHGREGFKTLSHAKGVFEQTQFNLTDAVRPPFGRLFERVVTFLMH